MIRTKFSLLFLFIFATSIFAQKFGKIIGQVTDFEIKPVAGVNVILIGSLSKTHTDRQGNYVFDRIYTGKYSLFVFKSGFFSILLDDIEVKPGDTTKIDVHLKRDRENLGAGAVEIKISDEQGDALSKATAIIAETIIPKSKKLLAVTDFYFKKNKREAITGEKGIVFLGKIPAGRYSAIITHKGFSPHLILGFLVSSGETTRLKIKLQRLNAKQKKYGKIVGSVHSVNGEAIPGANIFLQRTTLGAASDIEGNFVIQNVPPGKYNLLVRMIGFKTFQKTIGLTAEESRKLDITLTVEKFYRPKSGIDTLEDRVYELRSIYFTMPTDKAKARIKKQMRDVLENIFSSKEKKHAREIEQLKRRIDMLEQWQRDRSKRKQEIIERRLKALLTIY